MSPVRVRPLAAFVAAILSIAGAAASAQSPAGLAKFIPSSRLVFQVEFDGLDAHAPAWNRSAANRVLNEAKLGALIEDLVLQGLDAVTGPAGADRAAAPTSAEFMDLARRIVASGGAFGVWQGERERPSTVLVLRRAAVNGSKPLIERILGVGARGVAAPIKVEKNGRKISILHNPAQGAPAWWAEADDLVVTSEEDVDKVLAAIDGAAANSAASPVRNALRVRENDFEPILTAYVDVTQLPIPPREKALLGLGGLKRIDYRWGIQDSAIMSIFRLVAPAPRSGLLSLLDGATFEKTQLPSLPPELHGFTVVSADPGAMVDKVVAVARGMDPRSTAGYDRFLVEARENLGIDIKKDVLNNLGPRMAWAMRSGPGEPIDVFFIAGLRSPEAMTKTLDKLMPIANAILNPRRPNPRGGDAPAAAVKKTGASTWTIDIPEGTLPPNFIGLRPTIRVGSSWLFVSSRPEELPKLVAQVEGRGKGWTPKGDYVQVMNRVPSNLVALSVEDPRDGFPQFIEGLPLIFALLNNAMLAQGQAKGLPIKLRPELVPTAAALARPLFPSTTSLVVNGDGISVVSRESIPSMTSAPTAAIGIALLLPAVQAAREAARRAQCVNNLKQIGLAMHNHHSVADAFPMQAITDKNGKPLLSWRVAILPYIEQQELYKRFHLDEPWDSPHNKALIPLMPKTYQCPSNPGREGFTHYLTFAGKDSLFEPGKKIGIRDITDGTSFTLMVVEASKEVEWTRPEDLPFDPRAAVEGIGSKHPGVFNALLADGSVRFLSTRLDPATIKSMVTRNGAEIVRLP